MYIGKLVHKKRPIADDAGVDEDLDVEAPMVVQYLKATRDHYSMVDTVLEPHEAPKTHEALNFVNEKPAEE